MTKKTFMNPCFIHTLSHANEKNKNKKKEVSSAESA